MGHCWGLYGSRVLELLWGSWRLFLIFYAILEVYTWFQKFLIRRCQLSYNTVDIFVTTSFYKFFAVKLIIFLAFSTIFWWYGSPGLAMIAASANTSTTTFRVQILPHYCNYQIINNKIQEAIFIMKSLIEFQRYNNVH